MTSFKIIVVLLVVCGCNWLWQVQLEKKEVIISKISLVELWGSLETKLELFSIFRQLKTQDIYRFKERSLQNENFGAGSWSWKI